MCVCVACLKRGQTTHTRSTHINRQIRVCAYDAHLHRSNRCNRAQYRDTDPSQREHSQSHHRSVVGAIVRTQTHSSSSTSAREHPAHTRTQHAHTSIRSCACVVRAIVGFCAPCARRYALDSFIQSDHSLPIARIYKSAFATANRSVSCCSLVWISRDIVLSKNN